MQFEPLAPVPAVTLARRLREIPLFRFASIDELFRVSAISQQVRYAEAAHVQEKGARADYIQVLMEGAFEIDNGDAESEILEPPALLGFQEVLEGTAIRQEARARKDSIALVMPAEEFRTLLSANIELAQGLFRMLLEESHDDRPPSRSRPSSRVNPLPLTDPLKNVDKVMYLQTVPVFARATGDELFELAGITREVDFEADRVLFTEGHPSSIWMLLTGTVAMESARSDAAATLAAGDCVGVRETLAGSDWSWRARSTSPLKALEIEREALFELLANQMGLLQGIFGAIYRDHRALPVHD